MNEALFRIIIIDASPEDRAEIRRLLLQGSSRRYTFEEAETAAAGVRAVLDGDLPDLIILDYSLPDMEAPDVLASLTGRDELPVCPVLVLTGWTSEGNSMAVLRAGAQDFLGKGWMNPESLTRSVESAVERFRLTRKLRESEMLYRDTFANAAVGIAHVGLDGRWIRFNDAVCRITGYMRKELQTKTFADVTHPDDIEPDWDNARRLLAGETTTYSMEKRYRRKDGNLAWINLTVSLQRDKAGSPQNFISVIEDITARKQAETALRESEERMRLATEATKVGIWEWNVATGAIQWDAEMFRIYGIAPTPDGLIQYGDWSGAVLPEDLPEQERVLRDTVRRCGNSRREFRIQRRNDGARRHIEAVETVRTNAQGQTESVVGTNLDVTDRKRQEEELRRWRDALEMRVQERTQELLASQDRLRALATELNLTEQRERKRLAGELHDHLAQLLVLCRLNLGRVKRIGLLPRSQEIINETEEVLSKALAYSRTLMAELSPSVLQEHGLPAGLTWLGGQMQHHGLRVTVDVEPGADCSLSEDCAILLFQSVRELLMNALKHAHSNEVAIRLEHHEGMLVIEVRDRGDGFDLAAAGTTTITALSSKFGLFSIRERMRALGGRFDLESAPGQGTRATLVLPLRSAEIPVLSPQRVRSETQHSLVAPITDHASRIRVLLVDDHALVRQGLRNMLESYYDVEVIGEACNGQEAVALVEQLRPSIVVMDINMPKMNGIEATAEITSRYPGTLVIGLSVNSGGATEEAMNNAGAVALLSKETAVEELYRTIRKHWV